MTTTPPPIPPVLLQKNKFQELARASWIAPLIGVGVNVMMVGAQIPADSKFRWIGSVFCLVGFLCGLIALFGIPKYGTRGILGPAICGLSITGLMIALAGIGVIAVKKRSAQNQQSLAQAEQEGKDSFLDYPGWLGKAQVSGGVIVIASINELSPASQEYNSRFGKKVSMVSVAVNNMAGNDALVVDPYSLKIVNADGSSQNCERADEVSSSVAIDRQGFIIHFSGPISVAPGQQSTDRSGFFTTGTDFSKAVAMTASVNGQEVRIVGQFLMPEQKKELFKQGQQIQK
jgi:hypothetical protein